METKETIKGGRAEKSFPASVAQVFNNGYKVVINRGSEHGVAKDQRFQIYGLSDEEIIDPVSNEPLGRLEIVRGIGKVIHIQPQMATLESTKKTTEVERKIVKKPSSIRSVFAGMIEEEMINPREQSLPFDKPEIGDKVRPI